MALTPEQFSRLQSQLTARKSVTGSSAPIAQQEPGFLERAGADIEQAGERVNQAIAGEGEFEGRSAVRRGTEAAAAAAGGVVNVASEALPSPVRAGLAKVGEVAGNVISFIGDKIGNIPAVQKWVAENPEAARALEEVAGTAAAGGQIAGSILAAQGAATGAQATANVAKAGAAKTAKLTNKAVTSTTQGAKNAVSAARSWAQPDLKASVQTVLKETPVQKFDEYIGVAKKAALNNKNATPLEVAGTRAQEALTQIQRKLDTIGKNKSAVLESSAGRTPVGPIVVKFRQQLQNALKNKTSVEGDAKVYRDVMAEAQKLGSNPTAAQVDRFVDFVQDRIYTAKRDLTVPVTGDIEATLRPITGQLNNALKAKLPPAYTNLNQRYSDMVGVRNELNLKLGTEGEKGGALMKRVFSPSDANTKRLFAQVLDETGIDLVNEATLARYIMDILGDARQKSMLEQLNLQASTPTAGSLTARLIDYLVEKANSPEELIRRAREMTVGGAPASSIK